MALFVAVEYAGAFITSVSVAAKRSIMFFVKIDKKRIYLLRKWFDSDTEEWFG